MAQWLRLFTFSASNARSTGSNPSQETRIPRAVQCSQRKKLFLIVNYLSVQRKRPPVHNYLPNHLPNHPFPPTLTTPQTTMVVIQVCGCFCFVNKSICIICLESTYKQYHRIFSSLYPSKMKERDSLGVPVVKNSPCDAEDTGSIPGQGTKIPHAAEQLSLHTTTGEPLSHSKALMQSNK